MAAILVALADQLTRVIFHHPYLSISPWAGMLSHDGNHSGCTPDHHVVLARSEIVVVLVAEVMNSSLSMLTNHKFNETKFDSSACFIL